MEGDPFMATCSQCGAETKLYVNGIPMCVACSSALAATVVEITSKLSESGYAALILQPEKNKTNT
jgi:hypothetical protein